MNKLDKIYKKLLFKEFNLKNLRKAFSMDNFTEEELKKPVMFRNKLNTMLRGSEYDRKDDLLLLLDTYIWILENYVGVSQEISKEKILSISTVRDAVFEFTYRVRVSDEKIFKYLDRGNLKPNKMKELEVVKEFGPEREVKRYYSKVKVIELHDKLPIEVRNIRDTNYPELKELYKDIGGFILCEDYYLEGDSIFIRDGEDTPYVEYQSYDKKKGYLVAGIHVVEAG